MKGRPSQDAEIVHSAQSLLAAIVATSLTLAACAPTPLQRAVAPTSGDEFEARTTDLEGEDLPCLRLEWARNYAGNEHSDEGPEVFVTCHHFFFGRLVRLYRRDGDQLTRDAECQFGPGQLECPTCFTQEGSRFLLLTHDAGGSASSWTNRVFWIEPPADRPSSSFRILEVPIERPVDALQSLIGPGQYSPPLRFGFSIWNSGDYNNFPTGGWVEGTLASELDDQGTPTRFQVDSWRFHGGMDDEVQGS